MYFLVESVICSIPPDNMNDCSFEIKKSYRYDFLVRNDVIYRFVNASLSVASYRSPPPVSFSSIPFALFSGVFVLSLV